MADKFHAQLRHALGIPILLERENAQKQVVIARQLVCAARTRRPDLRRNELDDFRIPFREWIVADVFLDRLAEAQVEPAVIHADDHVRLAFDRQREQLVEQPPKFEIFFQHVRDADDRVLRQVEGQFHAGGGHLRPPAPKKTGADGGLRMEDRARPSPLCFDAASSAATSSAASKSPLASPAMSMKVFGFKISRSGANNFEGFSHGVARDNSPQRELWESDATNIQAPAGAKEKISFP